MMKDGAELSKMGLRISGFRRYFLFSGMRDLITVTSSRSLNSSGFCDHSHCSGAIYPTLRANLAQNSCSAGNSRKIVVKAVNINEILLKLEPNSATTFTATSSVYRRGNVT